jgi:hypothetical protein
MSGALGVGRKLVARSSLKQTCSENAKYVDLRLIPNLAVFAILTLAAYSLATPALA